MKMSGTVPKLVGQVVGVGGRVGEKGQRIGAGMHGNAIQSMTLDATRPRLAYARGATLRRGRAHERVGGRRHAIVKLPAHRGAVCGYGDKKVPPQPRQTGDGRFGA